MPSKTSQDKNEEPQKEDEKSKSKESVNNSTIKPALKKETEKPVVEKTEDKPKPKKNKKNKKIIVLSIILVVVVILGGLTTVGIGVYKNNWDNQFTKAMTNALPYPAAMVNGKIVRYSDFQSDVEALQYFYEKQKELYPDQAIDWTVEGVRENVMDRLIEDEVVSQIAVQKDITVSQEEVDSEFDLIISQASSKEEVEKTIEDLYGWTPDQFKEKVLRKYLLRSKLDTNIKEDPEVVAQSKTKAEEALAEVKKGEKTFAEVAQEYSEDATAANGGELGYFGRGEMVSEFEEAAFALENGEVSDIVVTQFGYHIIKVDEKVMQGEGEEEKEVVNASHILVLFPTIDEWLVGEVEKAKIYRLVKT
ncbi:MAG: peptidylprolyl isomerase [Patescibacteria group bacterium]